MSHKKNARKKWSKKIIFFIKLNRFAKYLILKELLNAYSFIKNLVYFIETIIAQESRQLYFIFIVHNILNSFLIYWFLIFWLIYSSIFIQFAESKKCTSLVLWCVWCYGVCTPIQAALITQVGIFEYLLRHVIAKNW